MVMPFLSSRFTSVTLPGLQARGIETEIAVSGQSITFDRNGTTVGPILVAVVWANREPAGSPVGATDVIGLDGDLHGRPTELTVQAGDLFMVNGQTAEVMRGAIVDGGVAVAGFRITTSGGD